MASNFRKSFTLSKPLTSWYPGHMLSGLKRMQNKLTEMDLLIEVHDARIPLSGRNPTLRQTFLGAKPHILLLNKKDLTDQSYNEVVESKLQHQGIDKILYTNLTEKKPYLSGFDKVLPSIVNIIRKTDRYNRSDRPEINVMVMGIPNVGKSCLINRVRQLFKPGKPAQVGATAGVTRAVQERIKMSADPLIYVLDTPGILEPKILNVESYMKLALCSSTADAVVGIETIADYALFWLNRNRNIKYIHYFDLKCEPSDEIAEILCRIAVKKKFITNYRDLGAKKLVPRPDMRAAAGVFLKAFRDGQFGKVMLDTDLLKKQSVIVKDDTLPFETDYNRKWTNQRQDEKTEIKS